MTIKTLAILLSEHLCIMNILLGRRAVRYREVLLHSSTLYPSLRLREEQKEIARTEFDFAHLTLSGVDRRDCLSPCFSVLCRLWIELVLSQIAPHSVHPPQSGPSSRSLPSHLHRCYLLCNICVFSSHGHTTKGVSGRHTW